MSPPYQRLYGRTEVERDCPDPRASAAMVTPWNRARRTWSSRTTGSWSGAPTECPQDFLAIT